MEYPERQVLFDTLQVAALAAGATEQPNPTRPEVNEVWEIDQIEVFPPVTPAGVVEDLLYVYPMVDGQDLRNYVQFNGRDDNLLAPPQDRTRPNNMGRRLVSLGLPIWAPPVAAQGMLSTTLKVKETFSIYGVAGPGGPITQPRRYRAYGYRYREADLVKFAGIAALTVVPFQDRHTGRVVNASKAVGLSKADWDKLPGGRNQSKPSIYPFMRFAQNLAVTTPNPRYFFDSLIAGQVVGDIENLWFRFAEKDALIVRSLGLRTTDNNIARVGLYIDGLDRPRYLQNAVGGWPATRLNNPFQFGSVVPKEPPAVGAFYYPLGDFDSPYLILNEQGGPFVLDNGALAAALSTIVALGGIRIEL